MLSVPINEARQIEKDFLSEQSSVLFLIKSQDWETERLIFQFRYLQSPVSNLSFK